MTTNRFRLNRALLCCVLLGGAASAAAGAPDATAELAVIIDDLGYNLARGQRVIALPGPLTVAVLPFTPNAARLAELAAAAGKDVILHQPMQANDELRAEPGTLTTAMSEHELRRHLVLSLAEVPHAVGVSNHTGSLLTTQRGAMLSLMAEVHARGLFFLDSRTTADTVARDVAEASGVPALRRDVFLDNQLDALSIAAEFERAVAIARRQGHAVLIAHPHDLSLAFLESALPALAARGVAQIRLTHLINTLSPSAPPVPPQARVSLRTTPAL